ncbi:hypothetical protein L211DRAFT_534207 [Terfezia boudieri ATCC MYA-4762]|uniref:Uncharacterized protein n=1 Tax=Terfezia boudieri ATCC MYA-4762 TaxID=1051890 RepID=A0A3N4LWX5_9PEZI|nr:hypothetical protein L211DRAFT_534207 [Terfezia boudieri ATCC MYA-4762]
MVIFRGFLRKVWMRMIRNWPLYLIHVYLFCYLAYEKARGCLPLSSSRLVPRRTRRHIPLTAFLFNPNVTHSLIHLHATLCKHHQVRLPLNCS